MGNDCKFSGKADDYAKFRPTYPEEFMEYLAADCDLHPGIDVADIGSGTGILTRQLLTKGVKVFAVEPNFDMREKSEAELSGHPGFVSVNAQAEHTGLADQSIDLITVAQAFHWFDPGQFQLECRRILKPGGKVALVWNRRDLESPMVNELGMVCRKFCPDFKGFSGELHRISENFRQFFRDGIFESRVFQNDLVNSKESFVGGMMSSSYSLNQKDPEYQAFVDAIVLIFNKYSYEDRLIVPNMTHSYVGLI